ncbi:L,D-transpeptidase, partial [Bacillus vallismortis]|nr:L,D-transpeptidase [Bacillus vallismortis]
SLLKANPSRQAGLTAGQSIVIPGLPDPNRITYHISVSIGAKTLTLFQNNRIMKTNPIAVGKILTQTPTGEFYIINRQRK